MVTQLLRARAGRLTFAGSLGLMLAGSLVAREISEYRLGDTIEADITTPVALNAVDPDASAELKQKEALRVPAIFRFDPAVADAVEKECRAAFAKARKDFLRRVGQRFGQRQLDADMLASPRFRGLVSDLELPGKPAPISTNLAALWARGESGSDVEAALLARVRTAMERPMRSDFLPAGFKLGYQVRLVAVTNRNQAIALEEVAQLGRIMPRTNLVALSRVRKELLALFPPEERALARFAAAALRSNCFADAELTQQARARQTEPLFAADRYEAGQVIAKSGAVVDAKIRAALDQLLEKTAVVHLQQQVGEEQAMAEKIGRRNRWLWAGLVGLTLVLIATSVRLARRWNAVSLLPARVANSGSSAAVIACPSCNENIVIPAGALEATPENVDAWQERALAAEQRADRAHAAIRAGVLSQFAGWMRHTFVRGLISQRSQMIEAQKSAAAEVADMERRLDELRAPLQERLRAYEQRVAELEQSLAAKNAENRELLQAKIKLTRQHLQAERERNMLNYNWVVKR